MSQKPRRTVLSSRISPNTGEHEFYELTPEEAEAAIKRFIDSPSYKADHASPLAAMTAC